jgi:subtilisin family serine protease
MAGRQIASPGASLQAITVGSYDYNDQFDLKIGKRTYGNAAAGVAPLVIGGISDYSNPGPLRIGNVVKPELAAPGRFHPVAFAQDAPQKGLMEKTGRYWYMDGTSSATPYVAGVIALMLEKNPGLTVDQVRTLLRTNLTRDRFTGTNPGAAWGYGKLDLRAVKAAIAAVPAR